MAEPHLPIDTLLVPAFETPLVSFTFATSRGTACDPVGFEGLICHTTELATRGAGTLARREMDAAIDSLGAFLGVSLRKDYLLVQGGCLRRHLPKLLELAHSILQEPSFSEEEHEKLLRETNNDLDDLRDDDHSLLQRYFHRHVHPGHIYCRTAIGTKESLTRFDHHSFAELHQSLFRSPELSLGIAGAVDDDDLTPLLGHLDFRDGPGLSRPDLEPPVLQARRRLLIVNKPERKQCQVAMGHLMPPYGSQDFDALRVAEAAFGGMFSSRLMGEIRVKEGWSYGADCSLYRARGAQSVLVSLAPNNDVAPQAIARVMDMYRELAADGLRSDEFDFARSYLQGSAAFGRATASQRVNRRMQARALGLPSDYEDGFADRIGALSVDDVNQALRKHAKPESLLCVVVCSADVMRSKLERLDFDEVTVVDHADY